MKRSATRLALTAALAALVLSGCGDDEPSSADDPASTPAGDTSSATTEDTSGPTDATSQPPASETTDAAETVSVPVFFVGETPQGPRLFAEQRDVEADNPVAEALALSIAGDAQDPDYGTLVPDGSLEADASFDGVDADGTFGVTLADGAWAERPADMSKAQAKLAVQQLVYTLVHASGGSTAKPGGAKVAFYLDGEETPFLGVPSGVKAADELTTRGLVNVLSPAEGETVSGSFTARGDSSSFEATVAIEITDESGAVVFEHFATAEGWFEHLYPWETEVDVSGLAPGTYTFVARTDDPTGGEGPGPTEDTKTIVVE